MSCNLFVHADPTGGSKYISGTTCDGTTAYYTLTFGQSVCMNTTLPYENLCGLILSGSCLAVTPTPTTTPLEYCIVSGLTYSGPDMGFPGIEVRNRTTQTFEITIRRSKSKEGQSTTELVS